MPDTETDDRIHGTDNRRKWLGRILFSLGIVWGIVPMISIPIILFGIVSNESGDLILAGLFNGMTVLPASALAFWQRKTASWWLIADAVLMAMVGSKNLSSPSTRVPVLIVSVLVPGLLGGFGLYSEKRQWPPLLDEDGLGSKVS